MPTNISTIDMPRCDSRGVRLRVFSMPDTP